MLMVVGFSSSSSSSLKAGGKSTSLQADMTFSTCTNTYNDRDFDCIDDAMPVLNGMDLVSYFTEDTPVRGSEEFRGTYQGHVYWFSSVDNLKAFDSNPKQFVPAFGSFCAYGVSAEFMPDYPWDADCLGPNVNPMVYEVLTDAQGDSRLFLFLSETPRSKFMENPTYFIAQGEARWRGWYKDLADESLFPMNTKCYNNAQTN
jgi:YHS domain-containing protein